MFPPNLAVRLCIPGSKLVLDHVATPSLLTVTVASWVVPSKNITTPVLTTPLVVLTVAVRIAEAPVFTLALDKVSAVVVVTGERGELPPFDPELLPPLEQPGSSPVITNATALTKRVRSIKSSR